jgi:hypothetical protein
MRQRLITALVGLIVAIAASQARASLIGTSVTGVMNIGGTNYFDPTNGFVPVGPENKTSGITVTISNSAVEFGYQDAASAIAADFSGTQLTLTDNVSTANSLIPLTFTFTDTAFSSLSKVSDTFLNGGVSGSIAGDVITITWAGSPATTASQSAVFNVGSSPVPEPATIATGLLALPTLAWITWKKKSKTA